MHDEMTLRSNANHNEKELQHLKYFLHDARKIASRSEIAQRQDPLGYSEDSDPCDEAYDQNREGIAPLILALSSLESLSRRKKIKRLAVLTLRLPFSTRSALGSYCNRLYCSTLHVLSANEYSPQPDTACARCQLSLVAQLIVKLGCSQVLRTILSLVMGLYGVLCNSCCCNERALHHVCHSFPRSRFGVQLKITDSSRENKTVKKIHVFGDTG